MRSLRLHSFTDSRQRWPIRGHTARVLVTQIQSQLQWVQWASQARQTPSRTGPPAAHPPLFFLFFTTRELGVIKRMEEARVVLHVDCDEFFLQVHARRDARIAAEVRGPGASRQAVVAKAAGVKKHQSPAEVRRRLTPDGRLLHAYWRKWPGPRVSYQPYQAHILKSTLFALY